MQQIAHDSASLSGRGRPVTAGLLSRAILFISGMNMALPGLGLARAIQLVRGVFIDDVLIALYIFLLIVSGTTGVLFTDVRTRRFAWLILALGALGVISTGVNAVRVLDLGQALHLFLFCALLLLAGAWARRHGATFVLRWYLSGLAIGGLVNLIVTFVFPIRLFGLLPVLYLGNGAGGALGIGAALGAYLMLISEKRRDRRVAAAMVLVAAAAAGVSWSKTAMSICGFGLLAWCVLGWNSSRQRPRRAILPLVALFVGASAAYARFPSIPDVTATLVKAVTIKFSDLSVNDKYSVGSRYTYFFGVADIVRHHPLAGVSYGGFYDAMTHTAAYASGNAVDEDPELGAQGSSNPHNSFLYYASANGVPGFMVVVTMFLLFCLYLWKDLVPFGWTGRAVCACILLAYFIYANTLPTLYNLAILYIPTAVILSRLRLRHAANAPLMVIGGTL